MDPHTSVLALLIIGWIGGAVATALRLPRIVPMILFGIALYPAMAPSVMNAPTALWSDAQNPASSIRTMALLVALARGGLSLKASIFRDLGVPVVLLATVPYAAELIVEALVAPALLPAWYGAGAAGGRPSNLVTFASASVWAPLSPSIVIPNMLAFVDQGLTKAGHLVLTGAPLEVSTALITEGVMSGCLTAINAGADTTATLGHIPTYIIGSILYGFAFAVGFYAYSRCRDLPRVHAVFGKPDPSESKLVFLVIFLLCYTTSIDSINTPWWVARHEGPVPHPHARVLPRLPLSPLPHHHHTRTRTCTAGSLASLLRCAWRWARSTSPPPSRTRWWCPSNPCGTLQSASCSC